MEENSIEFIKKHGIGVEVGFLLNKSFDYYDSMLKKHGGINILNVETHDIYYTNKNLDGLTENKMKNSCVRFRNYVDEKKVQELTKNGYIKIFDTIKKDHQYKFENINGIVQLQEIKDIGLMVYYDNSKYYKYDLNKQRNLLIDELNSCGFNFKYDDLGLDKLRTLYYKENKYSKNQNG